MSALDPADPVGPGGSGAYAAGHSGPTATGGQLPFGTAPVLDNRFAWILALTPLVVIPAQVLLSLGVPDRVFKYLLYGFIGLAVYCVQEDARNLELVGVRLSRKLGFVLAVLLAPAYLVYRALKAHAGVRIVLGWCTALAVALAGYFVIPSFLGVTLDGPSTERGIAETYRSDADLVVDVSCPHKISVKPGESFECTVVHEGESVVIDVTLEDTEGSLSWAVRDDAESTAT